MMLLARAAVRCAPPRPAAPAWAAGGSAATTHGTMAASTGAARALAASRTPLQARTFVAAAVTSTRTLAMPRLARQSELALERFALARRRFQSSARAGQQAYAPPFGQAVPPPPPPPPPSPTRRAGSVLWRLVRLFAGIQLGLLVGMLIGWQTTPWKDTLRAMLLDRWPTDAESLEAYAPPDAASAAINARIVAHPLARRLRADPDYVESRPALRLPAALRKLNLTAGVLAGPGRIAVPPLQFAGRGGRDYVCMYYLGPELCGHPGIVHGGLLATLLDEGLARCCFQALPSGVGVTASLKVEYKKPVMAEGYYVLRAKTDRVEGRKAWVTGWIEKLDDNEEGVALPAEDESRKMVAASALFIEPRNAKMMASLYKLRSEEASADTEKAGKN